MNSQPAAFSASSAWVATASEKPPSAGFRPAGPVGSGAIATQSPTFEVSGLTTVE